MYKLSEAAAEDIEGILTRSMLDFGLERTETYFQSLTRCLKLLADNPEIGSTVGGVRPGYRCFLHESHAIFYTPREQDVLIVRILHKRIEVDPWVASIGLDPHKYGTHSMRRTKAALIYKKTGNLRAVQLLLGHTKLESTVRYLGVEVDDALRIAEQVEL